MPTGIVRWFSDDKGYGVIAPDDADDDVRVDQAAVRVSDYRALQEGQRVQYELEIGPNGPRAVAVRPI